jgi:hypothetical protein
LWSFANIAYGGNGDGGGVKFGVCGGRPPFYPLHKAGAGGSSTSANARLGWAARASGCPLARSLPHGRANRRAVLHHNRAGKFGMDFGTAHSQKPPSTGANHRTCRHGLKPHRLRAILRSVLKMNMLSEPVIGWQLPTDKGEVGSSTLPRPTRTYSRCPSISTSFAAPRRGSSTSGTPRTWTNAWPNTTATKSPRPRTEGPGSSFTPNSFPLVRPPAAGSERSRP